jgi:low temperature requirement protein LtrA
MTARLVTRASLWPANEHHVRRPGWDELFFDLVFAAAISQLSAPLDADYTFHGVLKYAFLLLLVFLAWFGFTTFVTQFAADDILQRAFIVAQVFLVALMAANATGPLSSRDAAGFGAAFGGVRIVLALQYARVLPLRRSGISVASRIIGLLTAAMVWIVSALLPAPARYGAWTVALLVEMGNAWLPVRRTTALPPGAAHFPERFGLLTIILLGEFVASTMRGIETQMGWSVLAASAAILSVAVAFALWSCYSDGASGCENRLVRTKHDVIRLRFWVALHFFLFVGIGLLGVGARHAIALPPGESFRPGEHRLICLSAGGIMAVIIGIAATSPGVSIGRSMIVWVGQGIVMLVALLVAFFGSQLMATAVIFLIFLCFASQTALLVANRSGKHCELLAEGEDSG